jgi:2-polyprenyl-3-methyl-5-hydroxy-6-metoxy-1,4-benzoquinol methylase
MEHSSFKISDKPVAKARLNPEHIMQIGFGYWASKTLLAAIKLELFTTLAATPTLTGVQLMEKLKLHKRSYLDFLDVLVSLNFLKREGSGPDARYSNTAETEMFLDKKKPSYIGGILEMSNNRLYKFWGNLEEALITGEPQNESKENKNDNMFAKLYADPVRAKEFLNAMAGIQLGAYHSFVNQFDFSKYKTICDAGGAIGAFSSIVAKHHPAIKCISYDLPEVEPFAKEFIAEQGLSDRVDVQTGNFFDKIPHADFILMGNILHDWSDEEKITLIKKAFEALPPGGVFVCIENIIDNDRRKNTFGLLMSLNMLIETSHGRDYTFNEFCTWTNTAGFTRQEFLPLAGPTGAAIAYK